MANLLERAQSSLSASAISFGITKKPEPPQEPEFLDDVCPKLTYQQVCHFSNNTHCMPAERQCLTCCALIWQRLIGFSVCFTVGCKYEANCWQVNHCVWSFRSILSHNIIQSNSKDLITFMSFKFFIQLIEGSPVPFVVNYTIGNVLSLLASMFLCGPRQQWKNMMDEKRKTTSIVYISCIVSTLVLVFIPIEQVIKLTLLILLIIIQLCAQVWYTLSYIPLGRRAAKRTFRNVFGLDDGTV